MNLNQFKKTNLNTQVERLRSAVEKEQSEIAQLQPDGCVFCNGCLLGLSCIFIEWHDDEDADDDGDDNDERKNKNFRFQRHPSILVDSSVDDIVEQVEWNTVNC